MSRVIEIRAGEGGADSKIFVAQMTEAYLRLASRHGWKARASASPDTHAGNQLITIEIDGKSLEKLDNESGGHRLQRVPPTERNGRVHSSTITVAVLDANPKIETVYSKRSDSDLLIEWYSGTGCGGQHRNKHQNSCRITHLPSGIVKSAQTRSRENSLQAAKTALFAELDRLSGITANEKVNDVRKSYVGSGQRSDKRRTVRFQADQVIDHVTNKRMTVTEYMKGKMDNLW